MVRVLAVSLAQTLWAGDAGALSEAAALAQSSNHWALDDRTLHLMAGVLGVALGGGVSGVSGAGTLPLSLQGSLLSPVGGGEGSAGEPP